MPTSSAHGDAETHNVVAGPTARYYIVPDVGGLNFLPAPIRPAMTLAAAQAALTEANSHLALWKVVSETELLALRQRAYSTRQLSWLDDAADDDDPPEAIPPHPNPCLAFDDGAIIGHYVEPCELDQLRTLLFTWQGLNFRTIIDLDQPASFPSADVLLEAQRRGWVG